MKPEQKRERFEVLNAFVTKHGAFITSLPGDSLVRIEAIPGSRVADELRRLGHDVVKTGEGERILPHGIVVQFILGDDGERKPVPDGWKGPMQSVTHAGICRVEKFEFRLQD